MRRDFGSPWRGTRRMALGRKVGSEMRNPSALRVSALAAIGVTSWLAVGWTDAAVVVVGRDASATVATEIRTFSVNGSSVAQTGTVQPFGPTIHGGARVAIGDVNHNGKIEAIAGAGP